MIVNGHWLEGVDHSISAVHGGGLMNPKFVVMHYTAGWSARSAFGALRSRRVSWHVTVDRDGSVHQHMAMNSRAWHAGPSEYGGYSGLNSHSIGIEFVNPGFLRPTRGGYIDAYNNVRTADDVGPVVSASNARVGSGTFFWPVYPSAQIEAGLRVLDAILGFYRIIDVVSHEEIDTRGWKTDPGPAFPMRAFKALLPERAQTHEEMVVTASRLNVRSGPGVEYARESTLREGASVKVVSRKGDWVRIGSDEWVHGSFLRLV